MPDDHADVLVHRVASDLLPRTAGIAAQNVGAMLCTLAFGITPQRHRTTRGHRSLMSEGGNVTHLLRACRIGHERVWRV